MSDDTKKEQGQVSVVATGADLESLNYSDESDVQIQAEKSSMTTTPCHCGTLATAGPVGIIIAYTFVGTVIGANQMAVCEASVFAQQLLIEFSFGILKILLVLGMVIVGLVIDLGGAPNHDRLGFRYWINPGPLLCTMPRGLWASFSVCGKVSTRLCTPLVGFRRLVCLQASRNIQEEPSTAQPSVCSTVSLCLFIMIFILSMIIPYNDPAIAEGSDGTARGSPFVIAIERAGIKVLPHIVNAVVLTSALSAANLQIVKSSRTIFALASRHQLPKFFLRVNRHGLPYVAVAFSCCFLPLAYMLSSLGASTVFSWFQNITSSNILFNWIIISVNHIAMSRAMRAQGYSRDQLPYKFKFGEFAAWYSLFFAVIFLLTGGFTTFIHGYWKFSTFFSAYFIIPLSICLYIFAKVFWKTKIKSPNEVPLKPLFYDVEARPEPPYPKIRGWQWINILWS
ncbi:Proline-specific permease [Candida viswanathii]|uniref:Proline-specific permease n=1 Tax=Candida viswanathii TaxID=5486 RepID=A0A367YKH8_9ASCO|nr:Proline-specific permease [Candida viswanathii]